MIKYLAWMSCEQAHKKLPSQHKPQVTVHKILLIRQKKCNNKQLNLQNLQKVKKVRLK